MIERLAMCDAWPFSCWCVVNQHQSNNPLPHPAFECIGLWPVLNIEQYVFGKYLLMVHVSEWMNGWLFDLQCATGCVVTSPNVFLCHEARVLYKADNISLIISGMYCH